MANPPSSAALREYLLSLTGAPYVGWKEGMPIFSLGGPFYTANPSAPSASIVQSCGINCAGLTNVARLAVGLPPFGGTSHWQEALLPYWKPFDPMVTYPALSLVFRPYCSEVDQGHLAILWSGDGPAWMQGLFHSSSEKGVALDEKLGESHSWAEDGYYKMICPVEAWLGTGAR